MNAMALQFGCSAEGWELEAGSRKPEAGSRKPEAGSRKPEAGSRKLEAGSWKLLVPQGFNRIESRRLERGEQPEEDADARRESNPQRERPPRQRDGEARQPVDAEADAAAEKNPQQASHRRQEDGFDQELPQDLAAARA